MPSQSEASSLDKYMRRTMRRTISILDSEDWSPMYSLSRNMSRSKAVTRSNSSPDAGAVSAGGEGIVVSRAISYRQTATACPRFMDFCCWLVGMCISQWQWLRSSFDKPEFLRAKQKCDATLIAWRSIQFLQNGRRAILQDLERMLQLTMPDGCGADNQSAVRRHRRPSRVFFALASTAEAPTADRASRKARSYGFTIRKREKPKLHMARAAAPIFRGFRVETRTTQRRSDSIRSKIYFRRVSDFALIHPTLRKKSRRMGHPAIPARYRP